MSFYSNNALANVSRIGRFAIGGGSDGNAPVSVTNSTSTSPWIKFAEVASGNIALVSGTSTATLTFYCTDDPGVDSPNIIQICDATNTAKSVTVGTNNSVPIPDECFAWPFIMIVSSNATNGLLVVLKG